MLGAARQALEAAAVELNRLRDIASLDRGALKLHRDWIKPGDALRSLEPLLRSEGERRGLSVRLEVAPGLPRIQADRARLHEALELLLRHVVRHAEPGPPVVIAAEPAAGGALVIDVRHGPAAMLGPDVALAQRVIAAHGGRLELAGERTVVTLGPTASSP